MSVQAPVFALVHCHLHRDLLVGELVDALIGGRERGHGEDHLLQEKLEICCIVGGRITRFPLTAEQDIE